MQAVIGAGAAGLVAARELVLEGHHVTVFEKGSGTGGVWVYTDEVEAPDLLGTHSIAFICMYPDGYGYTGSDDPSLSLCQSQCTQHLFPCLLTWCLHLLLHPICSALLQEGPRICLSAGCFAAVAVAQPELCTVILIAARL